MHGFADICAAFVGRKKKAEAKEKEDKETKDKLAAAEKLKTQNTTLTKSLEDVVKEKEKVQEEYQATQATILELQVLKEAWLKENLEADKLQAMKAWYAPPKNLLGMLVLHDVCAALVGRVRDMKRNKPEEVQTLLHDYYKRKDAKSNKQATNA